MKFSLIFAGLLLLNLTVAAADALNLQTGDIIFQSSESPTNKAIELATHSKFAHVGIIFTTQEGIHVLEAGTSVIALSPFNEFVQRGNGGYYEILRLKNAQQVLNAQLQQALLAKGKTWLGKQYDFAFSWNDEELYCSELVYKLFADILNVHLAQPKPLQTFDLSHPLVQEQLKLKYGEHIPYDEKMISPQQIYESDLLEPVRPFLNNNNLTGN